MRFPCKPPLSLPSHGREEMLPRLWRVKDSVGLVSIRPRPYFSPSYNKVKSQTKHVWLLTLFIFLVYPFQLNGSKSA